MIYQRSAIPNTPCSRMMIYQRSAIPNTPCTKNDDIPKVCNTMFKNDGNKSEPLKSLKSILDVLCLIVSSYEAARSGK